MIAIGDDATPIFPRSAVKVMQALVLVEFAPLIDTGLATPSWRLRARPTPASRITSPALSGCWRARGSTLRPCSAGRIGRLIVHPPTR